jgi:hypothetical protein
MKCHSSSGIVAGLLLALYAGFPGFATAVNPPGGYRNEIPIIPPTIPQGDDSKRLAGKHEFVSHDQLFVIDLRCLLCSRPYATSITEEHTNIPISM